MGRTWDVVVIGGGVAGGLAALDCARRGLSVLVVEKRVFPRWKVCGCCFNAQAQGVLEAVGQGDLMARCGAQPLQQLRIGLQGQTAVLSLPGGWVLSRERFDQALLEAAAAAGATVRFQTRGQLGPACSESRNVRLTSSSGGPQEDVQARVVLVAAGLVNHCSPDHTSIETVVTSRVGAGCVLPPMSHGYASNVIHMALGNGGYVGLVQREDGALNLAAAFDRSCVAAAGGAAGAARSVLMSAGFDLPADLMAGQWQLTPALTRRPPAVAGSRCLLIGDAAGYVEPFTGEGMAWALTAGGAAAPFVVEGLADWSPSLERRWLQTLESLVVRRQRVCRALATVLQRPLLTSGLFSLCRVWPRLPERIVCRVNRVQVPPAEIC
ncbi:NAD(P)/FAD-dependent oxidoreductase [Synechococcus sp. W2B2]|uniref:NAD(P)/FAD-dependent oxidoreductase n=1 Tax=unclassified Synechococcus TaxID=2626047 RepID=UPI00006B0CC1|nr:FAD-dependent oxidoreductase [Synechococcus sp. WH 7805]EAR18477.1 NAD binding site [Synechococcus sp. WH 7805]